MSEGYYFFLYLYMKKTTKPTIRVPPTAMIKI